MAVTEVVARLYDSRGQRPSQPSPSEKGFDEAIDTAVNNAEKDREVCYRCGHAHAHALRATPVFHKISDTSEAVADEKVAQSESSGTTDSVAAKTSEVAKSEAEEEISEGLVNSSAAYRFSIYIRTTSDIASYGASLMERFQSATEKFISALNQDSASGINLFDSYLGQAATAVENGESKTASFIDQMLQAADNGLKSVTASMNSASALSGLNLSMNSSLPGTSAADIAGIYLQDAIRTGSINSSGVATVKSTGQGSLRLIRTEELLTTSPALTTTPTLTAAQQSSPQVKNQILDRFLQLIEGLAGIASPQQTEVHFSLQVGRINGASTGSEAEIIEKMPEVADGVKEVSG